MLGYYLKEKHNLDKKEDSGYINLVHLMKIIIKNFEINQIEFNKDIILEENSNFEVNSISQSIEELFKLRDKIDPSVNKVLKNFYKSLILKNYAADLSRAYLRRRRFFFKNDSEVIQDEDLKESYRTTKSKDQMKANFNIKYRSSKLENLKSEHKKDSRENSPRHIGQEFSSLKSIFKMTHTKQDKILHSKITFITSVLKSDE